MAKEARLNVQGLARREKLLLSCIKPSPGYVLCSSDASAGEPSVVSHFSKDPVYKYCTFDGVGKRPYYDSGRLLIDDIYLAVMSISPIGRDRMQQAFAATWPAGSFADQWIADAEVIKGSLKKERQLHKMIALALAYGMRPKKMVKQCYEAGHILSLKDATALYNAYWSLFAGVKAFADRCTAQMESESAIVNPFGFRSTAEPAKAFNAFIQGSVSGIIHVYITLLFAEFPDARLVTIIHDELLIEVPIGRAAEFTTAKERAVASLNAQLNWDIDLRFGLVFGGDWYSAK